MNVNKTRATKAKEIRREWYLVDVKNKILGRIATHIAQLLLGKQKPYFVKNLDCGDYVVVTNASYVVITGNKPTQKLYTKFSGFPGGLKKEAFKDLVQRKPEEVIRRAVYGMLPKNKLRDRMVTRLFVFGTDKHPYQEKFKLHSAK